VGDFNRRLAGLVTVEGQQAVLAENPQDGFDVGKAVERCAGDSASKCLSFLGERHQPKKHLPRGDTPILVQVVIQLFGAFDQRAGNAAGGVQGLQCQRSASSPVVEICQGILQQWERRRPVRHVAHHGGDEVGLDGPPDTRCRSDDHVPHFVIFEWGDEQQTRLDQAGKARVD